MTFQCQLNGCNHPRFTQAAKVIDHVRCNHSREFKRTNKDMDLFRKKMISMPRNIMSFTCKQCRIVFHGDVKIAIVHLVLEHGQNVPQRNDFVFQCRICGPRALFDNERQLESHCKMHLDEVSRGASRSPSSDRSSVDRGSNRGRSRSRSRSYSPRMQGGRAGSGDRENGGNRGGAKSILRCHFCTDEFRTLAVRKNHMLRDHRGVTTGKVAEIAGVPKISSNATFVQVNFVRWQYVKITCSMFTGSYFLNVHYVHLQTCTEGIWFGIYVNTTEKNMDFPMVNWSKNLSICPKI